MCFSIKLAKFLRTPILKNTYSFKLFPDLNLRLAKIKPFTTVCISKFSRFCSHTSSFLYYQVRKLRNSIFSYILQLINVKSNRCFSGLSLILWEYCENDIKTFWYYSYENKSGAQPEFERGRDPNQKKGHKLYLTTY